ncbi:MBL fold metallo-hydrolase [Devosia sp.]|uniref:MBL fold metallo-hydrolase n=1 Tax=Devosia sp. TaxID=1871048 RepID=UPI0035B0CE1E
MAAPGPTLVFDTDFPPSSGRVEPAAAGLERLTAPNAGPYTFRGTNSFLIGGEELIVVDPGPDDDRHFEALLAAIGHRPVRAILLTHTHRDHSALAPRLQAATRAPLWFGGPHRLSRPARPLELNPLATDCDWQLRPDRTLVDGDEIGVGGQALRVISTPGHCANHLAFALVGEDWLLTGDHVMGWNSTLVSVPDGSMADYLASLEKVIAHPATRYLPAHGGTIGDGRGYARALLAHREHRNAQIVAAVDAGARSIGELLRVVYPGLPLAVQPAARMTLAAHVEYLADRNRLAVVWAPLGAAIHPAG